MIKILVAGLLFLLIFSNAIVGQNTCLSDYRYDGPPGDVFSDSSGVIPGSVIQIDFCTMNVPDRLLLFFCGDTLSFYVGKTNDPYRNDYMKGYKEIFIDSSRVDILTRENPQKYSDTECRFSEGAIRIFFTVPRGCCKLSWRIEGNLNQSTKYLFCLQKIYDPVDIESYVSDTIQIYHCGPASFKYTMDSCDRFRYIEYIDARINLDPIINLPSCGNSFDGSIEFPPGLESYNIYGAGTGVYYFDISNATCTLHLEIPLFPAAPCNLYIPNAFSPNNDGVNDTFEIYSEYDYQYELRIYTRWGELIFQDSCIANHAGWSPGDQYQPGVYVYVIVLGAKVYSGSLVIIL